MTLTGNLYRIFFVEFNLFEHGTSYKTYEGAMASAKELQRKAIIFRGTHQVASWSKEDGERIF